MSRWAALASVASLIAACAAPRPVPHGSSALGPPASASAAPAEPDDETEDHDGDVEATDEEPRDAEERSPCPSGMVLVASDDGRFCIDKYEASLVERDADGNEKPFPHYLPVDGHSVRAVSQPDVFPQGFISEVQAEDACAASGKRLCSPVEWKTACMGPSKTTFPYGNARQSGVCHDNGKSAVASVFGASRLNDPTSPSIVAANNPARRSVGTPASLPPTKSAAAKAATRPTHSTSKKAAATSRARPTRPGSATAKAPSKKASRTAARSSAPPSAKSSRQSPATKRRAAQAKASVRPASVEPSVWSQLNDPRLGQVEGGLSKTGSHEGCVNGYGVVDMVGNLHEWVKTDAAQVHGQFSGGYYLDTSLNGDGCNYKTAAHAHDYHDYSTGFRCCAEVDQ